MNDVSIGELLVRMVVSLGFVLLLVLAAYLVVKRRVDGGTGLPRLGTAGSVLRRRSARDGRPAGAGRQRPAANGRNALKVLGRTGVGRASNVMAVQFADRVLLLGASDGNAPVVLADVELLQWELAAAAEDDRDVRATPLPIDPARGVRPEQSDAVAASLGLIEALREATARRG